MYVLDLVCTSSYVLALHSPSATHSWIVETLYTYTFALHVYATEKYYRYLYTTVYRTRMHVQDLRRACDDARCARAACASSRKAPASPADCFSWTLLKAIDHSAAAAACSTKNCTAWLAQIARGPVTQAADRDSRSKRWPNSAGGDHLHQRRALGELAHRLDGAAVPSFPCIPLPAFSFTSLWSFPLTSLSFTSLQRQEMTAQPRLASP